MIYSRDFLEIGYFYFGDCHKHNESANNCRIWARPLGLAHILTISNNKVTGNCYV